MRCGWRVGWVVGFCGAVFGIIILFFFLIKSFHEIACIRVQMNYSIYFFCVVLFVVNFLDIITSSPSKNVSVDCFIPLQKIEERRSRRRRQLEEWLLSESQCSLFLRGRLVNLLNILVDNELGSTKNLNLKPAFSAVLRFIKA